MEYLDPRGHPRQSYQGPPRIRPSSQVFLSQKEVCLLSVGDKVIYPQHGAAVVKGTEEKEVLGEMRKYYVLRLTYGDLTLKVPTDNTEAVGIRDVIAKDELEKVFKVLKVKECRMPSNWSRRFKTHLEKLRSGDIYQVAEVVRNLARRDAEKGLSAGEKRMLQRAKQILLSEVVFAADVNEDEAENMLAKVLA